MSIKLSEHAGAVVKVGGQCYQFVGMVPADGSEVSPDEVFGTCEECAAESSGEDMSSAAEDPPIVPVSGMFYQCSGHFNNINGDACAIDGNTTYVPCFEAIGDEILANEAVFPCEDRYWSGMANFGAMTAIIDGPFPDYPSSVC